jgi:hypothetical protein
MSKHRRTGKSTFKTVCRSGSVGIATVGAGALLFTGASSFPTDQVQSTAPEVQPTAAFSFYRLIPWAVAPSPAAGSTGAATVATVLDDVSLRANAVLNTVNRLGPLSFGLDSLRSFSAVGPPPGSTAGTANYTQMDQWMAGVAGLASSTGALGFTDNAVSYDPYIGTHAGVLQTANRLGPLFFDLNVLKAIGFTQAPTGEVLPNGQPDNFSSVDIGRWSAGIPGVFTNSGTTGFVTYQDFANGPFYDYRVGGLHTTTQVGPMTFDFKFLPFVSTGILLPPTLSFGLSPDMTAANTAFALLTPPPPGVVQPNGGLPVPPPVTPPAPARAVAASVPSVSAARAETGSEAPAQTSVDENTVDENTVDENTVDETSTPEASTPEIPAVKVAKSPSVIPGVNGAPLAKPPTAAKSGMGGGNPLKLFKPINDMITKGIGAFTGPRPAASSSTAPSGGQDSVGGSGAGSESGTGSDAD